MAQIKVDQATIYALRKQLVQDGIEKTVVGAVVIDNAKVLVLRRAVGDFMAGLVELSSGTVDSNEEILDALMREVKEETGLQVTLVEKYTGRFDYTSGSGKKTRQLNFRVKATGSVQVNLAEHDAYFWVDPNSSNFDTLNISDETRKSIKDV